MTSKISFFKLIRENGKRQIGPFALAMLVFFLFLPLIFLLVYTQNDFEYYLETGKSIKELKIDFFLEGFKASSSWLIVVTTVGALICGVSNFSYLFSKKKIDLYHAIPVRREKLFAVNYVDGILVYVIPYLLNLFICLIFSFTQVGFHGSILLVCIKSFLINFLCFLLLYHMTILAVILAGNMINAFVLIATLGTFTIALYSIFVCYQNEFFDTYVKNTGIIMDLATMFSPFALSIPSIFIDYGVEIVGIDPLKTSIMAAALLAISFFLYQKRPSEAAERSIAFPKIIPIIRSLLVLLSALTSGFFFYEIGNYKMGWMIFGVLFGGFLIHCILEILYHMSIRKAFSHKIAMAVVGSVSILFACSFRYDWWRFDTYLPEKKNVASMAISGIDGNSYEYNSFYRENENGIHYERGFDFMEITDFDPVYETARLGISSIKSEDKQERINIDICYRLKNGKNIYRNYWVPIEEGKKYFAQIYADENFKQATYPLLSLPEDKLLLVEIEPSYSGSQKTIDSYKAAKLLLNAYQQDKRNMTYEEEITQVPCSVLTFLTMDKRYRAYIYPSFTNTLEILRNMGFSDDYLTNVLDPNRIKSIAINGNLDLKDIDLPLEEDFSDLAVYGVEVEYTDREKIEQLCQVIAPNIHFSKKDFLYEYTSSEINEIRGIYETEYGEQRISLFLYGELPDFIKQDFYQQWIEERRQEKE